MILTEKETQFLQDFKCQEQLCIDKYNKFGAQAVCNDLKSLFSELEKTEQEHLQTIDKILNGEVPPVPGEPQSTPKAEQIIECGCKANYSEQDKENDAFLCKDALAGEKHVSSVYNTGIFEFKNDQVRDMLNHIQKEEQKHGKYIYDYMSQNGMYQ